MFKGNHSSRDYSLHVLKHNLYWGSTTYEWLGSRAA